MLIYAYGCKAPRVGFAEVDEQIHLAHRYYNMRVEIERERRFAIDTARQAYYPEIVVMESEVQRLTTEIEAVQTRIKQRNAIARSKSATAEDRAVLVDLKTARKAVYQRLSAAKKAAFDVPAEVVEMRLQLRQQYKLLPAGRRSKDKPVAVTRLQSQLDQLEAALQASNPFQRDLSTIAQHAAERVKAARKASKLYWCNYASVEMAVPTHGGPLPQFKKWTGTGKVSVQLQGGLSVEALHACTDTRLQIVELSDQARQTRSRPGKRTTLRFRVNSKNREPVWAECQMSFHRSLPPKARIKWAYLIRERVAQGDTWKVSLVIDEDVSRGSDCATTGSVGVDVGWRLRPEGLRVAYWMGSDGEEGELVIPLQQLQRWKRPRLLRSDRDTAFDAAVLDVRDWLADKSLSEAMTLAAANIAQWRSHGRLAKLLPVIADEYPDEPIVARLTAWDRQDRKVWKEEAHTAKGFVRYRDNLYREFAAMLRCRYQIIRIEDLKWSQMQRKVQPEADSRDKALTEYVRASAPYRLQQLIGETAAVLEKVPAMGTTAICSTCGQATGERDRAALFHTCTHCGITQDQDRNAAINLLAASGAVSAERT